MTPTEEFVHLQVQPLLEPEETVLAIGYLSPTAYRRDTNTGGAFDLAAFAALTDRRIFLVKTRNGAFSPLLENHGVEEIDRAEVRAVYVKDELYLEMENAPPIIYQAKRSVRQLPSQQELFRLLTASFPRSDLGATRTTQHLQPKYFFAFVVVSVLFGVLMAFLRGKH